MQMLFNTENVSCSQTKSGPENTKESASLQRNTRIRDASLNGRKVKHAIEQTAPN